MNNFKLRRVNYITIKNEDDSINIWEIICLLLEMFFSILSIIFTFLKEKSSIFINVFNSISKEERENYYKKKLY